VAETSINETESAAGVAAARAVPPVSGMDAKADETYRLFLVEDSAAIREALVSSLESSGLIHVIGHAESAAEAWDAMVGLPVDAVIVDLHLRGDNGFDLLWRLQKRPDSDALTKIVLTNYATPAFRQRCLLLGAHYFFDKSLEFDRVIEVLEAAATAKAGRRDH